MPAYLPPDYLDNTSDRQFADALTRIICEMGEDELDIVSGFFEPTAWRDLRDVFPRLSRFRLLIGRAWEEKGGATSGAIELRRFYNDQLRGDLEKLPYDAEFAALIDSLLAFLQRENVGVRLSRNRFLHAKAYIFPRLAVVGSSNLTPSGLHRAGELNLVQKQDIVAQQLRGWFESFWDEAEDYKQELVATLEASKFGQTPYTPFEVFIKALYEYFQDRLTPESIETRLGVDLASFQKEGLHEAIRLLERHKGVLVADAVGLGKTYIGVSLLEHYVLGKRTRGYIPRGLVMCPAQIRDLVWQPRLDEFAIKATVLSQEEVGQGDFNWQKYMDYDVVLVDESHNFRNPATQRYQNLSKLIATGKRDKYVILMTATPINNSIWDLYQQLMLITRGSDTYYRDHGISNLVSFFRRVDKREAELFDLLEQTTVRRSRHDIRKRQAQGERIELPGKGEVRFPERNLESIRYDLTKTYAGFYNDIAAEIEKLALVSYNVEEYKRDRDPNAVQRNEALIGIQKTIFLKRLESSLRAFEVSVRRQRDFQSRFFEQLRQGRLLDSPRYRKILAMEEEEADSEDIEALIGELDEVEPGEYNLDAIRQHLEADLAIFDRLLGWIEIVQGSAGGEAGQDAKLAALKAELAGPLKGQKVLLFSYFKDTAQYLRDSLLEDKEWYASAGKPLFELITGATPPKVREQLVKRFAPISNTTDTEEGRNERQKLEKNPVQILISTDVLSEGQNLQDAGIAINYDLHWNPVRMIQRAGRVDRLGTQFQTILVYNCFPEEGLEALLGLVERLQKRIADIDRTVGLDASVLGEVIHPKSLEDLRRIKAGDKRVWDEYEDIAELTSTDEMKLPLLMYLQSIGEARVKEIPLGIHSGKIARTAGTFFAFKARDRHFWRLYPADGGEPITEKRHIFHLLQCAQDTPRVVPKHTIYELLERATKEIMTEIKSAQAGLRIRPPMTRLNQRFYTAINQPTLFQTVPEELRQRLNQVLENTPLRPFERERALKQIRKDFEDTGDVLALANSLDAYFVENGLYRDTAPLTMLEQIKQEELQLVCYEVLATKESGY